MSSNILSIAKKKKKKKVTGYAFITFLDGVKYGICCVPIIKETGYVLEAQIWYPHE